MGKKKFHAANSLLLAASSGTGENTRSKYNAATKNELQHSPAGAGGGALDNPDTIQNEFGQETGTGPGAPVQDWNNTNYAAPRGTSRRARRTNRRTAGFAIRGKYELTSANRSFV
jgi:hypothetical protein